MSDQEPGQTQTSEKFTIPGEIVFRILNGFTPEELQTLKDIEVASDLAKLHLNFGMWIRNEYNFWDPQNPLTRAWAEDRQLPPEQWSYMEQGIDCHPCHPDNVSSLIIREVWYVLKGLDRSQSMAEESIRALEKERALTYKDLNVRIYSGVLKCQ